MDNAVLVVEDDRILAETTRALLEWEGYRVRIARNGQEGLVEVRCRRPCVVLLDLMMPVMTGWDFITELNADPSFRDLPVIIVSAVADQAPPGAAEVLAKPYEMSRLLELVGRHCPLTWFEKGRRS